MKATLEKIREQVLSINDPKELRLFDDEAHRIIMQRYSVLELNLQQQFSVGDSVIIEAERRGNPKGKVIKLKQKNVVVRTEDGKRWSVSPSYLRKTNSHVTKEIIKQKPFVNCFGIEINGKEDR